MALSGFNHVQIHMILKSEDGELYGFYREILSLLDQYATLLVTEISSAFRDLDYFYDKCHKTSSPLDFIKRMVYGIRGIRGDDTVDYTTKFSLVKDHIDRMALFLCSLSKCSDILKAIYMSNNKTLENPTCRKYLLKSLKLFLSVCGKIRNLQNRRPSEKIIELNSDAKFMFPSPDEYNIDELRATFDSIRRLTSSSASYEGEYPLSIIPFDLRRPSSFQRYMGRYILAGTAVTISGIILIRLAWSGQLARFIFLFRDIAHGFIMEHMLEPLRKLGLELVDTLRRREGIVSREDLEQSNRALTRMLEDYAANHKIVFRNSLNGGGSASSGGSEEAMEFLMRKYESELHRPVQGLIFGSLLTAMLIQMQKLKVHTEAAMLTMDQILTSNELTMAATAAMPAMAVLGGVLYLLRVLLFRPSSVAASTSRELRLALAEVDRALQEVYTTSARQNHSHQRLELFEQLVEDFNLHTDRVTATEFPSSLPFHINGSAAAEADTAGGLLSTNLRAQIVRSREHSDAALIARGMLIYRLRRFASAVVSAAKWSQRPLNDYSIDAKEFCSGSGCGCLFGLPPHFKTGGWTEAVKGPQIEYGSLFRDLLDLCCPDFEIDGNRKLYTLNRIRTTYQGLVPPRF